MVILFIHQKDASPLIVQSTVFQISYLYVDNFLSVLISNALTYAKLVSHYVLRQFCVPAVHVHSIYQVFMPLLLNTYSLDVLKFMT